jgi:hypothetical protein
MRVVLQRLLTALRPTLKTATVHPRPGDDDSERSMGGTQGLGVTQTNAAVASVYVFEGVCEGVFECVSECVNKRATHRDSQRHREIGHPVSLVSTASPASMPYTVLTVSTIQPSSKEQGSNPTYVPQ